MRKSTNCERERKASSDEFNDQFDDMTDSPTTIEEHGDRVQTNHFSIECENETVVPADIDDKFGAMVSSKLLLMSPLQRLMSQKIISEILLKGQLGMLKRSLSPVLVAEYMENKSNTSTNCSASSRDDDSDDCDPLMCQVKAERMRDTNFETFEFVKDEMAWSDDD